MRGAESVVDVNVAQLRQLLGQRQVVLFLALLEAGVFEHEHITWLERRGHRFDLGADDGGRHLDLFAEQFAEGFGRGLKAELGIRTALGPAEVAHEDEGRALIQRVLDGRQGGADALVVRHLAAGHGHVEVHAHQHALALEVDITHGLFIHGAPFARLQNKD